MAERVTKIRFFTISDFVEEEIWLRERSREGLHFHHFVTPCFYVFEKGEPEDVIYRLDFTNNKENSDYFRMLGEYGWENCGRIFGWIYWRRPASETANEAEGELFSDDESRLEMVKKVWSTRMIPILAIFLCIVMPQFTNALGDFYGAAKTFMRVFWTTMFALYFYLVIHCGAKLGRLQRELERDK